MKESKKACEHAFLRLLSSKGGLVFCGARISVDVMQGKKTFITDNM